jgi:hypothetical protein
MGNTDREVQGEFAESDGQEMSISLASYANEPEVDSESGTEDATTGLPPEQSDDAAAAKSYVPAHALSAGATYNVLLMAALPKNQMNIDVYKELVKVQSSWDKIKRTDDDACRFDVSVSQSVPAIKFQDFIFKSFGGKADKLHLLHITCHGLPGALIFEDGFKVKVSDVINKQNCKALHGVFLNACYSGQMKDALLANGAAFVITCNQAVLDDAGLAFAEQFYKRLFLGQSLYNAFKTAEDQLKLLRIKQGKDDRSVIELHCNASRLHELAAAGAGSGSDGVHPFRPSLVMQVPDHAKGPDAEAISKKVMGAVQAKNPSQVEKFKKGCHGFGKSAPEMIVPHAKAYYQFLVAEFSLEFTNQLIPELVKLIDDYEKRRALMDAANLLAPPAPGIAGASESESPTLELKRKKDGPGEETSVGPGAETKLAKAAEQVLQKLAGSMEGKVVSQNEDTLRTEADAEFVAATARRDFYELRRQQSAGAGAGARAGAAEQILQKLAGNSSDRIDTDDLSPVSHVLTTTTSNASGEGGHVDEARSKMCEATGKGESCAKRRELFKDAIKLLRAEPLAGHAQALLSYAHYGVGVCRMREREYAEARHMLEGALQVGTGLSKQTEKLTRKYHVYCIYALGKTLLREGKLVEAEKEFKTALDARYVESLKHWNKDDQSQDYIERVEGYLKDCKIAQKMQTPITEETEILVWAGNSRLVPMPSSQLVELLDLVSICDLAPDLCKAGIDVDALQDEDMKDDVIEALVSCGLTPLKAKCLIKKAKELDMEEMRRQHNAVKAALNRLSVDTLRSLMTFVGSHEDKLQSVRMIFEEHCQTGGFFQCKFEQAKGYLCPKYCCDTQTNKAKIVTLSLETTMSSKTHSHTRRLLSLLSVRGNRKGVAKYPGNLAEIAPGSVEQTLVESRLRQGVAEIADCPIEQVGHVDVLPGSIILHFEFFSSDTCSSEQAAANYVEAITKLACASDTPAPMGLLPKDTFHMLEETGALEAFVEIKERQPGEIVTIWRRDDSNEAVQCTIQTALDRGAQAWVRSHLIYQPNAVRSNAPASPRSRMRCSFC